MRLTFVSNYINHHQIPFCEEMHARLGGGYQFIQTEPMEEERIRMGWGLDVRTLSYVHCYYEEKEACDALLQESDIVICGWTGKEDVITPRLLADKITLCCSERLYREGQWKAISPRGLLKKYKDHTRYRKKNVYLLCCGGYVASDFGIIRAYPQKKMKWGYFPRFIPYDIGALMAAKQENKEGVHLLWAGRFLKLKHPEYAVAAAAYLRERGYVFHMTMIGDGEEKERVCAAIKAAHLEKHVTLEGFMKPEEVRTFMERADIFLFTSDHLEGWGAVLNESMNSGCAPIVNHAAGAAPFLIEDGVNGLLYKNGNLEEFLRCVERLARKKELCKRMGAAAYQTIAKMWNAQEAAAALCRFCEGLLQGRVEMPADGPCSPAVELSPRRAYGVLKQR